MQRFSESKISNRTIFSSLHKGTSSNFLADSIAGIHSVLDTNYSLSVESIDVVDLTEINLQRYDGLIVMSQSDDDQPFIDYLKEKNFLSLLSIVTSMIQRLSTSLPMMRPVLCRQ